MEAQQAPHPWDSPGKNTGVGCHFLLQCMKVKSEREVAQSCLTLSDPMDCSLPRSSVHGIFQARVLEWDAIASFRARHTKLILHQCRNITLSIKILAAKSHNVPMNTSKLTTGHFSRQKRFSSPHQNTDISFPNQETLTSHPSNPTHSEEPPQ